MYKSLMELMAPELEIERQTAQKKGLEEGLMKGLMEGRMKGREEGRMEGREEGREEVRRETAFWMLRKGVFSIEEIADCCNLPVEELYRLKQNDCGQ